MESLVSKRFIIILFTSLVFGQLMAQNVTILPTGIGTGEKFNYSKLTYDAILALPNPQKGDAAYDLTHSCLRIYNGIGWICTQLKASESILNGSLLQTGGGSGRDTFIDVEVDAAGNIYVVGNYIGDGAFGIPSSSNNPYTDDIFIAKYNSIGSLLWVKTLGGNSYDNVAGLSLDASGNVFVAGTFNNTAIFGNQTVSSSTTNIFLIKYNSAGSQLWLRTASSSISTLLDRFLYDLSCDSNGDVYITGNFPGNLNFGTISKTSLGQGDIFIAKYTTSGVLQWVETAGGIGQDYGTSLSIDNLNNVLIGGAFTGSCTFGTTTKTSVGQLDLFIAKYNSSGMFQWVQAIETPINPTLGNGLISGIATDNSNNIIISGNFLSSINFGTNSLNAQGFSDVFMAKYNSSGSLVWAKIFGGEQYEYGTRIIIDSNQDIILAGNFMGSTVFEGYFKTGNVDGKINIFVAKCNSIGEVKWLKSFGGLSSVNLEGLAQDISGKLYVVGYFLNSISIGSQYANTMGDTDFFLAKFQE